jgi:hypothetical protein
MAVGPATVAGKKSVTIARNNAKITTGSPNAQIVSTPIKKNTAATRRR